MGQQVVLLSTAGPLLYRHSKAAGSTGKWQQGQCKATSNSASQWLCCLQMAVLACFGSAQLLVPPRAPTKR